ncbi:MAG: hypothetical protein AB7I57_26545, partial [Pirellulales bacterium]
MSALIAILALGTCWSSAAHGQAASQQRPGTRQSPSAAQRRAAQQRTANRNTNPRNLLRSPQPNRGAAGNSAAGQSNLQAPE